MHASNHVVTQPAHQFDVPRTLADGLVAHLKAFRPVTNRLNESLARPQSDRHQREAHLVDDSRVEKLTNGGDPAADAHVAICPPLARA